ncbi:PAS domain-containing hybrid sensor histidine kinase/response regulator [Solirubrobacter soli]|uniref:PAS domain-containing hybrid sensor histidine kinase/response regulator n=1 Tax=Solirubrobacter soli TaxID=363832 RepID=UPI00069CC251|nr:ATP-binding protein [Solirubrobacter soli]
MDGSTLELQDLLLGLVTAATLEDVSAVIAERAARATGAQGAAVWRRAGGMSAFGSLATVPLPDPDFGDASRPWLTPDLSDALRGAANRVCTATLSAGGAIVGALALVHEPGGAEPDAALLHSIARPAGAALARAAATSEALHLAAIVEAAEDAIAALTAERTITSWNPAAERLLRIGAAEAIGSSFDALFGDPAAVAIVARQRAGGAAETFETIWTRGDGETLVLGITLAPIRDARGELAGVSATARDLTAQRAAEARIRRLATVVEGSPSAVLVAALDGRVIEANENARRVFGVGPGARVSALAATQLRARTGETAVEGPVRHERPDGVTVQLEVQTFPIRDDAGKTSSLVSVVRDVSERERLADDLRLAQRLEALGRLAGGVAHDFNNLLTIISGFGRLARLELADGPAAEALDEALAAARRAETLTRQLLEFARSHEATPQRLRADAVVEEMLPALRALAGDTVRVSFAVEAPLAPVRCDRGRLEQIVMNLVVNARNAMPDGGAIAIAVDAPDGEYVRIAVRDTGRGMDEETRTRLFEPFFHVRGARTSTGLGLAIVHGAVTQAGGHITVESTLGAGSRFAVHLPVDPGPVAPPEQSPALAARGAARILVCDDERAVGMLVERILTDAGYSVVATSSPTEALALGEGDDSIAALVTDVLMPEMTGPELARRLSERQPALRVLFMSGWTASVIERGDWPERSQLLDKPFDARGLLAAVDALLTGPASF